MTVLELARRQRGWSQGDLGNDSRVRMSRQFISWIERGVVTRPDPDQLRRLARVLGVQPPERLLETVPEAPPTVAVPDAVSTKAG